VPVVVVSDVVVVGVVVPVVVVGVVVVVDVVVGVLVTVDAVVLVVVVGVLLVTTGQLRWASAARVLAPLEIALASRASTPERLFAEVVSELTASAAWVHLWAARAADTEFSWSFSALAWSEDRRPPLPPQAASSAIANPRMPARTARGR
jgi:hypothetical protein